RGGWSALLACTLCVLGWSKPAHAWLFFEHARLAKSAVQGLDATSAALFQAAWAHAQRVTPRYCSGADVGAYYYVPLGGSEYCVDFSALSAISADHSCTPADTSAALDQDYVLRVLRVAEETEVSIRQASSETAHVDVWHSQNVELQRADPQYLSRAAGNGAHFQLPSTTSENQIADDLIGVQARQQGASSYLHRALADHAPMNALALYVNYHVAALGALSRAAHSCQLDGPRLSCSDLGADAERERDMLFARAISEEAYALHFLEDAFSAGHIVGAQGGLATRMGTHDYYCEHGLAVRTWDGRDTYLAHGDSFMDASEDLPRVRAAVKASLHSFLHVLSGGEDLKALLPFTARGDFNTCWGDSAPSGLASAVDVPWVAEALPLVVRAVMLPPGVHPEANELGVFVMPNAQAALRVGLEDIEGTNRDHFLSVARLPARLRAGMGIGGTAAGVTNAHEDGTGWLEAHIVVDGRPPGSRIGTRMGAGASFHLPYFLLPGDLLPLAPIYFFDPDFVFKAAIKAADGGLLGLQSKAHGPFDWTYQFVLGREASFDLMPSPQVDVNHAVVSFEGKPGYWQLGLPLFSINTLHVSEQRSGLDATIELGYDLTRYVRDESSAERGGGARHGEVYHGLFL
ncbi:MAG TPA: hypothetical protein VGM29_15795, partial [Polyangiaceae bacterium]